MLEREGGKGVKGVKGKKKGVLSPSSRYRNAEARFKQKKSPEGSRPDLSVMRFRRAAGLVTSDRGIALET